MGHANVILTEQVVGEEYPARGGLAVEVMDVEGERLPDADGRTQNFVMLNGPMFQKTAADQFLSLKFFAGATDQLERTKETMAKVLRDVIRSETQVLDMEWEPRVQLCRDLDSSRLRTPPLSGRRTTHPSGPSRRSERRSRRASAKTSSRRSTRRFASRSGPASLRTSRSATLTGHATGPTATRPTYARA